MSRHSNLAIVVIVLEGDLGSAWRSAVADSHVSAGGGREHGQMSVRIMTSRRQDNRCAGAVDTGRDHRAQAVTGRRHFDTATILNQRAPDLVHVLRTNLHRLQILYATPSHVIDLRA